jgi:hypothetical protein
MSKPTPLIMKLDIGFGDYQFGDKAVPGARLTVEVMDVHEFDESDPVGCALTVAQLILDQANDLKVNGSDHMEQADGSPE